MEGSITIMVGKVKPSHGEEEDLVMRAGKRKLEL